MATVQSDRYLIRYAVVVPYGGPHDELQRDVPAAVESWAARPPHGYHTDAASTGPPSGVARHRWTGAHALLPALTVTAARTSVTRSASRVAVTVGYTPPAGLLGELADTVALHRLLVLALQARVRRLAESLDGVVTATGR